MVLKEANSVSDFKVINDGGSRRVSVFGMGWTGYTLPVSTIDSVFGHVEEIETEEADGVDLDIDDIMAAASLVVMNEDLEAMAHYFYNLGREHGIEKSKKE
jgi:hypothetical protein